jgi:archaemetzincin
VSVLALLPFGSLESGVLERLEEGLPKVFGFSTRRLPGLPDPPHVYDPARGQWSSTELLKELLSRVPKDAARLLGVTGRDLFVPVLSFVYGQAQLRGKVAVVSLARLRPEFHGFPADPGVVAVRALKEAVHEVGHTFGLPHCLDLGCPMSLSIGLPELDTKTAEPCPSCSALLAGSLDMPRTRSGDREGDEP